MQEKTLTTERPPVVVVLGHVDHGKSTLLDYIRSTSLTEHEIGGITQHTAAYEVTKSDEAGVSKRITFIDTPGHAAFGQMRERGALVADIAILVVAADDGVKPQTLEALEAIKKADVPFIVAINKIDKPGASADKAKQSLAEAGVYVEGYGGTVPVAAVSAKTGEGVDTLLSLIILLSSLLELQTDTEKQGSGTVIESHRDPRLGIQATIIVNDGKISKGDFVLIDQDVSPIRILSNWDGDTIDSATASTPIHLMGLSAMPLVGAMVSVYESKKLAESARKPITKDVKDIKDVKDTNNESGGVSSDTAPKDIVIPIVLKANSVGALEAVASELTKRQSDKVHVKIIESGVGNVAEKDIKLLLGSSSPLVIGFNVKIEPRARDLAENNAISTKTFDIIYKLTEWFDEYVVSVMPKENVEVISGRAKVQKTFSQNKDKQILGGTVKEGELKRGARVRIVRADEVVGEGKVTNLQKQRVDTDAVGADEQFGGCVESKLTITEGDILEVVSGAVK